MKALATLLAACTLLIACEEATAPVPTLPQYVFSGVVRNEAGEPLPNAATEISLAHRTTTTDERGTFRFERVSGFVGIEIVKAGYQIHVQQVPVASDTTVELQLQRSDAVSSDTIQLGRTIRSVVQGPACGPAWWDSVSPCKQFVFRPPVSGLLTITIRHGLWRMFVGIWEAGSPVTEHLAVGTESGDHAETLSVQVSASRVYEIRVDSGNPWRPYPFDLRADLRPDGR